MCNYLSKNSCFSSCLVIERDLQAAGCSATLRVSLFSGNVQGTGHREWQRQQDVQMCNVVARQSENTKKNRCEKNFPLFCLKAKMWTTHVIVFSPVNKKEIIKKYKRRETKQESRITLNPTFSHQERINVVFEVGTMILLRR